MDTKAVLARLDITRPQLQRLIRNGDIAPANQPTNPLAQRARRWQFYATDVERLAAHPPPRKPRTRTP